MIPQKRTLNALALAIGLALAATACTSVDLKDPATIEQRDPSSATPGSAPGAGTEGADSGAVSGVAPVVVQETDPLNDPASPLSKRSIYFQYDSFVVQPEYQSVVEAHARYLSANRDILRASSWSVVSISTMDYS